MPNELGSYSSRLAEFCYRLRFKDIPPKALHGRKSCILNAIGIILGTNAFNESKNIISYTKDFPLKKN